MKNLRWYWQRLSAMSPLEIPYRLRNAVRDELGRFRLPPPESETPLAAVVRDVDSPLPPTSLFPFVPDAETLRAVPERWREVARDEAERFLNGRFSIFALDDVHFGAKIDWNRDYSSEKSAPADVYALKIDVANENKIGDVKYIWEPARLQFLPRLAQHWLYSDASDARIPTAVVATVRDFVESNPPLRSIHWASPMEVALQLISLTLTFQLLRSRPESSAALTPDFTRLLTKSVASRLDFVRRRYSAFSSAGNHLIAEAAGAYFAANYWSTLKIAESTKRRAKKILVREINLQTFPDGVSREQSVAYSFFIRDLATLAGLSGEAAGDAFPNAFWERLDRIADFLDAISDRAGNSPNVGDEDGGRAFRLEERSASRVQTLRSQRLRLAAAVAQLRQNAVENAALKTPKKALKKQSNVKTQKTQPKQTFSNAVPTPDVAPTEEAFWLLAPAFSLNFPQTSQTAENAPFQQTLQTAVTAPSQQTPPLAPLNQSAESTAPRAAVFREFPSGGWQSRREICGDAETLLVFKAGPFGYPATAAHAHADALELLLHVDGVPVLIDPGTFSYQNRPERLFYRSSTQHNTLNFAKSEQSQYINRFLWGKKSIPELLSVDNYLNGASFAGKVRWHSGETHERRVEQIGDGVWRIVDRWRGNEPPTIRFHFAPEVAATAVATPDGTGAVVRVGNRRVEIANPNLAARLEPFRASPAFYRLADAVRLVFAATDSAGETATTLRVSDAD
ncbi:MAG: alginate lyase family protein [Thermoguttaceae bacterium]|nr:alginate lyase family protein [Thermoguttaceae bacterium]